jgi:hypothetical protein
MFSTDQDVNTAAQKWAKALTPEKESAEFKEYARLEIIKCADLFGTSAAWVTNPLEASEQFRLAVVEYLNAEEANKSPDKPSVRAALLKTAAFFDTPDFGEEAVRLQAFDEFRLAVVEYLTGTELAAPAAAFDSQRPGA